MNEYNLLSGIFHPMFKVLESSSRTVACSHNIINPIVFSEETGYEIANHLVLLTGRTHHSNYDN